MMKPEGIIPAVITPLTEREEVDEEALGRLLDTLIGKGVHGVFVMGTAGEFYAFSAEEKKRVFQRTVEAVAGRVPVYAGTAAESTRDCIKLGEAAREAGADFLSVLTPWFPKLTQDQLYTHYRTISEQVGLPMLLYTNPDRTGNDFTTETVVRLAADCENIVGVKDSTGNLTHTLDYIAHCPPSFSVIMGRDPLIYAALLQGAKGAIAASANVAAELSVGIYENIKAGRLEEALENQRKLHLVCKAIMTGGGNTAHILKAMMELQGLKMGPPRAPLTAPSKEQIENFREVLKEVGML
jgi:4-hydroxy-tetrahydrodipicolinate synthase